MSFFRYVILLAGFSVLSIGANAEVSVSDSWIRAVPAMMTSSAGYLRLNNDTNEHLVLIGARVDFANKAEIHNHIMSNGLMKMVPAILPIRIAPGSSVEFKPKGLHIMLMGLKAPLEPNVEYQIELLFESHAPVRFTSKIAMDSAGH